MSIGRSPRAWRRRVSIALRSSLPVKGISTATSLNSHWAGPGEGSTASAPSTIVVSSVGLAGLQMSVATRDMQANSLSLGKAVLIAGPTASGKSALVPHRLYGHVDAAVNFSAGAWVADAARILSEARAEQRLPIFVGGSGLYFK